MARGLLFAEGWVLTIALAGGLVGCGATPRSGDASVLRHGRIVFSDSCAGCHTLTGREQGAEGGDLAIARFSVRDFASFARIMPTRRRLTNAEVQAVSQYLYAVSSHYRR